MGVNIEKWGFYDVSEQSTPKRTEIAVSRTGLQMGDVRKSRFTEVLGAS